MSGLPVIAGNGGAPRILVVEDEAIIALELAYVLQEAGYEVIGPAMSIASALRLLVHIRPDAAVLDVNVRSEKVTPVATQLRAVGTPFVLCTAYGASGIPGDPVFAGVANIGKPTDKSRLLAELRKLIAPGPAELAEGA